MVSYCLSQPGQVMKSFGVLTAAARGTTRRNSNTYIIYMISASGGNSDNNNYNYDLTLSRQVE